MKMEFYMLSMYLFSFVSIQIDAILASFNNYCLHTFTLFSFHYIFLNVLILGYCKYTGWFFQLLDQF